MVSFDEFLAQLFTDPASLHGGVGMFQIIILMLAYGYVLAKGSHMISDGTELLLLVPSMAGIVGSIVLPVLGAVPDGAIILFSGLGPDAQQKLNVGVGALAGSTIMLLTLPWTISIIAGRVNLDAQGQGKYREHPKLDPVGSWHLLNVGINVTKAIRSTSFIMLVTCIPYFIIQGPAFGFGCGEGTCHRQQAERWYALAALILCALMFIGYLVIQLHQGDTVEKSERRTEAMTSAVEKGEMSIVGVFAGLLQAVQQSRNAKNAETVESELKETLRKFFVKYDVSKDNTIDIGELGNLMRDLGENVCTSELKSYFDCYDTDKNETLSLNEFVNAMKHFIVSRATKGRFASPTKRKVTKVHPADTGEEGGNEVVTVEGGPKGYASVDLEAGAVSRDSSRQRFTRSLTEQKVTPGNEIREEEEEEVEEEVEMPEDLVALPPDQQQRRIKARAAVMMAIGTMLVVVFSDPMVNVMSEFGTRCRIPPFYIAFVLAPLASNGSELIATFAYAKRKSPKSSTISFSALLGASCMNNTFCLGVFLLLIFAKGLAWQFSAETIVILVVQTHRMLDAWIVLSLYPLSIVLVAILENAGLN